jgi:hypothetical protein
MGKMIFLPLVKGALAFLLKASLTILLSLLLTFIFALLLFSALFSLL